MQRKQKTERMPIRDERINCQSSGHVNLTAVNLDSTAILEGVGTKTSLQRGFKLEEGESPLLEGTER
jgi:hypothetical protein